MAIINIPRAELREYGLPSDGYDGVEIIKDTITDNSRWSIFHAITFRWIDGKTYRAYYSVGATEQQDESPWEYDKEVECEEVAEVPVTTTQWLLVKERGYLVSETEGDGSKYYVNEDDFAKSDGDGFYETSAPAVLTAAGWHPVKSEKEAVN